MIRIVFLVSVQSIVQRWKMSELETKISCRFCKEKFELFEDLQKHRCLSNQEIKALARWLRDADKKVESFEEILKGC